MIIKLYDANAIKWLIVSRNVTLSYIEGHCPLFKAACMSYILDQLIMVYIILIAPRCVYCR